MELKTRRQFFRTSVLGGALSWTVPSFVARTWQALGSEALSTDRPSAGRDSPILVVLQLAGGNDGLNTLVPVGNDDYHRARPTLGLPAKDVIPIGNGVGLHPSLRGVAALLEAGHVSWVQGVGYPNPNRSHFRSMEIWQTASDSDRYENLGWIGRYFDHACRGSDPTAGVNLGRQVPQAFTAAIPTGVSLDEPGRARGFAGRDPAQMGGMGRPQEERDDGSIGDLSGRLKTSEGLLDYLDRTALDAQVSDARIRAILSRSTGGEGYPATRLAQSLKLVAQLIKGGMPTRVFYVSQGGYDTHSGQAPNHSRLLGELGDALKAWVDDLKSAGDLDRVLMMGFSEFGRRVAENGSAGTDHGAAGPMILVGRRLKSPLLGRYPSLAPKDLRNGDLQFSVDFRSVYAAALEDWLGAKSREVLGRTFEKARLFS